MVQGQTHLELTQCNRIHSKYKNHTEQEIPADIYTIFSGPKSGLGDPRVPNPIIG